MSWRHCAESVKPESTLFLIASKTFTTIETMTNAHSAKAWFAAHGGTDTARHFAALDHQRGSGQCVWHHHHIRLLGLGGRPLFGLVGHWLAAGHCHRAQGFREFLAVRMPWTNTFVPGAAAQPTCRCAWACWTSGTATFTALPAAVLRPTTVPEALARLSAAVGDGEQRQAGRRQRQSLAFATSPVLWGEPGTNGQHAYFQMLHQGTDVVPVEFVAVKKPRTCAGGAPNAAAGQCAGAGAGTDAGQARRGRTRNFPGNRPSTFLLLDELTPAAWAR
jgi:glucose-6-phosphate isomerase